MVWRTFKGRQKEVVSMATCSSSGIGSNPREKEQVEQLVSDRIDDEHVSIGHRICQRSTPLLLHRLFEDKFVVSTND
jgi:hypothetical protein